MRVSAFGLAAGWKLCVKMRVSSFRHIVFRARNWNPRKSNEMTGNSPRRFTSLAVDDLRLHRMQHQLAGREAVAKHAPKCPRLRGSEAVTDGIVRITLERDVRKLPRHPHIERVVQSRQYGWQKA